ncbi:short-chain dehydrogenase TIC 32, chloroplastic isoform X2 [Gossypium raimondii]|uniref:short-chain dehydrogenase TIC 32, chloroplastic isoform X2 n=1 Tax=Gossypium raimondii TaxID=29730 RepID=UPI00227B2255|nr:short-chain dehydrogenase TIC 32, chloroplastic isoform X2 [Gossypium raimondii]
MWLFGRKGPSGFSSSSTAEEVTQGIDGTGLTAIVTGASSGIGTETARVLALRGVHVIMGVRNVAAGRDVKEAIVKEIPTAKVDTMELDLSSMASVRKFAADFSSSGHFLLTNLLLDTMKKAARTSKREGRIINVSSEAHRYTYKEGIQFDKINDQSGYSNFAAYGQSKLANVLHANELAKSLKVDGVDITANSLHPGAIVTNLFRHMGPISGLVNIFGKIALKNVQQGAATTCYVALHPQVKGRSGEYFKDSNIGQASAHGRNAELAKKLWDFSMKMVK